MISCDLLIIGAGAAGLTASIFAAQAATDDQRIILVEGARKPGAKILVSGGGRCNVTNKKVTTNDYFGGASTIVRRVLKSFDEHQTIDWMARLGVQLKLEATGKYFPVTDKAATVLNALLNRSRQLGVELISGTRIESITPNGESFSVHSSDNEFCARRLIVATGGKSLPKSGSDGAGLKWLEQLGHTIIPTTPALAPLVLLKGEGAGGNFADFAGITLNARLTLSTNSGRKLYEETGSMVFTHFGVSGPTPMNISRHVLRHRLETKERGIVTMGHPQFPTMESADQWLQEKIRTNPKKLVSNQLLELYPERIVAALTDGHTTLAALKRDQRLGLARHLFALPLNVNQDRGWSFAETTAGGVDLREINPKTFESRIVPGLFLCGEVLDVDGRIGGFNFQWAWATGYLAGRAAASAEQ